MNDQALSTLVTQAPLDLAVAAWLDAKFRKSHSARTRGAYLEIITAFRAGLQQAGLDLDTPFPGQIALLAQAFAGHSAKGKQVAPATYNLRLAVLSSFYVFCRKQGADSPLYLLHNPIERVDRASVQVYGSAEALDDAFVAESLSSIDQSTLRGARDYALLCVLLQTARRAQEVATLTWQQVSLHNGKARLTFEHAKGNEVMQDDLPAATTNALLRWLHKFYGAQLGKLAPAAPLWVSLAHDASYGQPLGYQSITAVCKKYLGVSRVHTTRHTAAHSMEKLGLTVSEIQARLGHKSLATTGRYLASLRRAENRKADELAALYGIE
jgi:integrase